ncbi:MAG TPA: protein kinase [Candidatus Acidoferrales bacterium]|nr:protein kinase [Candidatus Acidoferrales bacterium]
MLKKLGKYELIEQVGRGAMGEVYKAQDPFIGRLVALKTITGALVGRPDLLERFYQEARSAGALQHPNIVTVYELGKESETPFIAMEFLEGESLESIIERRPVLTLAQKVSYIIPVCRALDYAHKRGVVHRDIKPGNVMITKDGGVKVVDFGIARLMDSSHTQTNTIIGTLGYMSPQQIRGERADERSDIWATGVMLYELLAYQRPFDGANQTALMLNIASDEIQPAPIKTLAPDCTPALESLLAKMLQKDITQRYQTMEEVLFDFEPIWRRLQEASVAEMIAGSEDLIRSKNFTRARDVLRRALQIDSRNSRAKTLLEQVNVELRQTVVRSQINSALERARQLLGEGRHKEAKSEAEGALKLDPENAPAKELIAEADRAGERARKIEETLRAAKQKLAEGALEDAADRAKQVLDWEAENPLARALQKQIEEQVAQREARKRLADVLQRARKLWADQKVEECIALLNDAQTEFAAEPEIARLMEIAKHEKAEQRKRQLLADAKALLADQHFDEALAATEAVAKEYPGDEATKRLRELIVQEREELARQKKLQKDIADLQALVNAEKYSEAVFRGEKLLREYPRHAELFELMNFARAEAAKFEQKRLAADALREVDQLLQQSKFQAAISFAERALARFPHDSGLESALGQARTGAKQAERQQLLRQRIAEIESKLNSGQQTSAAELARQTIASLGADEQVGRLLHRAEDAVTEKREKQKERDSKVAEAQTLIADGRFNDATQILQAGIATQMFSRQDPRVEKLFREIDQREAETAKTAPPPSPDTLSSTTQTVPPPNAASHATVSTQESSGFSATVVSQGASASRRIPAPETPPPAATAQETKPLPFERVESPLTAQSKESRSIPLIPIVVGLAALIAIAFVGLRFFHGNSGPTAQEASLQQEAQQQEKLRDWPGALASYKSLAQLNGILASDANAQVTRLQGMIDKENYLFGQAQGDAASGDFSGARGLYQQVADLHGDREQEALDAVGKMTAALNPVPAKPAPATHAASAQPVRAKETKKPEKKAPLQTASAATAPMPPTTPAPAPQAEAPKPSANCQLIPSDIPRYLEMADNNRGRGKYTDAEREYNSVLQCDPENERARSGLARTKQAEAIPSAPH